MLSRYISLSARTSVHGQTVLCRPSLRNMNRLIIQKRMYSCESEETKGAALVRRDRAHRRERITENIISATKIVTNIVVKAPVVIVGGLAIFGVVGTIGLFLVAIILVCARQGIRIILWLLVLLGIIKERTIDEMMKQLDIFDLYL